MINVNGVPWMDLTTDDIKATVCDTDESFFFEYKDDRVSNDKFVEEVCAFANSFGGYIFIGISDTKEISGCERWNEQRIHAVIHDSMSPTPSFDVKNFEFDGKNVLVVRVSEGINPPYITNKGKILERLSSGSFVVKDAIRLHQMHIKAEEALKRTELKLMIPPIRENSNNVYAYIDVGFCPVLSDETCALNCFNKADYESIAKMAVPDNATQSISFVGQSIVFSPGGLTTSNGVIPAHANNFIEIMCDGSAKLRILLSNNDTSNLSVNFVLANVFLCQFQDVYSAIFGEALKKHFIMARKYEKLTVLKQFYPVYRFNDPSLFLSQPELIEKDAKIADAANKHRTIFGTSRIITDDRIPKDGLYSLDDQHFQKYGLNKESDLIPELFRSEFAYLGLSRAPNNE